MENLNLFKQSIQNSYLKPLHRIFVKESAMEEAKAFAPCHITGFFEIFDRPANALQAGSTGAGISLEKGVTTVVRARNASKSSLHIGINGSSSDSADVSEHVIDAFLSRFGKMKNSDIVVEHHVEFPIGAGFGTSGASALGLALALNEAFGLGLSKIEAAQLAHVAEVECKTGLGTVIAETFGGAEIRIHPGAPGIGQMKSMSVQKGCAVACLIFGSLSTRKFLADKKTRKRVNELGGKLVDKLVERPSVANFMKLSRQFTEHVGLVTDKVRVVLEAADKAGFVCSMPIFGESVFTIVEGESLQELLEIFRRYGSDKQIATSGIDTEGARLVR
jgi:pantoate kinase